MELGLKKKKALVTGSTKGIGKAIAAELSREGADVVINGRNITEVNQIVENLQNQFPDVSITGAAADLAKEAERFFLFEQVPEIDILINNMGIFQPMKYWDITDDIWNKFFDTNVLSGNALAKFYMPKMLENNFGRVIL